jgi:hypothetical protein
MPLSTIDNLGPANNVTVGSTGTINFSTGPVTVASSTVVDFSASTSAMVMPRGTTAQRPASPVNGHIRYNTDSNLIETYASNVGWSQIGQDLTAFNTINTSAMPHSFGGQFQTAGSTKISTYGAAAMSVNWNDASGGSAQFGSHGGHNGVGAFPMVFGVYLGTTPKAVNRLRICLHSNCWGYFILEGSTTANTSGAFYNTGVWTTIPWTATGSSFSVQNMGGNGSGYGDGTIITNMYVNNTGYTHYRVTIYDGSRPNQSQGTYYNGCACYGWSLDRV